MLPQCDIDSGAEHPLHEFLHRQKVRRLPRGTGCFPYIVEAVFNQLLDFSNRQSFSDDLFADLGLFRPVFQRQKRPGMSHGNLFRQHMLLDLIRKTKQTKQIRYCGPVLTHARGNLFLRQLTFFQKSEISLGFVDRVQIVSLDVFDQRQFHHFFWRSDGFYDGRYSGKTRLFGSPQPPLACNQLEAVFHFPNRHRLDNALLDDGPSQFIEFGLIECLSGLIWIRRYLLNIYVNDTLLMLICRRFLHIRNQRL